MSRFEIGQDVVCVRERWKPDFGDETFSPGNPIKNCVYRIFDLRMMYYFSRGGKILALQVCEVPYFWYAADGFRPVRKTDISQFTKLLAPTPTKQMERV